MTVEFGNYKPTPPYILEVVTAYSEARYLKSYDPDGHKGWGSIECTEDPREAIQFQGWDEITAFRDQQSTVRPVWPNGEANRPLRALTIDIVKLCDA